MEIVKFSDEIKFYEEISDAVIQNFERKNGRNRKKYTKFLKKFVIA